MLAADDVRSLTDALHAFELATDDIVGSDPGSCKNSVSDLIDPADALANDDISVKSALPGSQPTIATEPATPGPCLAVALPDHPPDAQSDQPA